MTLTDILLIIVLIALVVVVLLLLRSKLGGGDKGLDGLQVQIGQLTSTQNEKLDRTLKELNERLREQDKTISEQLSKSNNSLERQFTISQKALQDASSATTKIIKEVTEKMTKLDETNKQVVGFAEQLQSLESLLKNPKRRGVLGEYYLATVLQSVLPPEAYKLQYKFKNGEIVDALVITREGTIPIDAKFSLENYNRLSTAVDAAERDNYEKQFKQDLMKRIDETSKYIRPDEGTLDFAFMFIPADGLYYDLLVQKIGVIEINQTGLIEYAFKKRVLIVTPTTFFAYLQTVMQGLKALKIEESTKEIQKHVGNLQRHLQAYETEMGRLGKSLGVTVGAYNNASQEWIKVDKDVLKISGGESIPLEVTELDKPQLTLGAN